MSYFSEFLTWDMQNSWKWWSRDENIDWYKESICYDSGRFLPGVPPSISLAQLTPDKKWLFISIIWSLLSFQVGPVEV